MPYKVVLVAYDAAPSRCFVELSEVLSSMKEQEKPVFDVELFIGDGKPLTTSFNDLASAVSRADIVLLGMSSVEFAELEAAAGKCAQKAKIPFGFYGDVRGCFNRAGLGRQFESLALDTAFYFGVNVEDGESARSVFSSARLYGFGNPLREKMAFPTTTRNEVREKLDVPDGTNLILAPGTKTGVMNCATWMLVIDALTQLQSEEQSYELIISPHPGDRVHIAADPETGEKLCIYELLVSLSPVPTKIVTKEEQSTTDMVSGADLIVCFGGSTGMEGAYQNIPVVGIGFEISHQWQEYQGGSRMPELIEDGASDLVVGDASLLATRIQELLTPEGFAPFLKRQKALYPKPEKPGIALAEMANAIQEMVDK